MTTLPVLATAFDAIDRSEINRRLHTGEAFDHACNQTLANIESLAEKLKTQLGDRAQEFEDKIDALITADHKTPATQALQDMGLVGIPWRAGATREEAASSMAPADPIEQVAPASSAAVVIAMLQDLAEGTDGTVPVRVVVSERRDEAARLRAVLKQIIDAGDAAAAVDENFCVWAVALREKYADLLIIPSPKLTISRAEFVGGEILLKCE